jgi:hypothetical protein
LRFGRREFLLDVLTEGNSKRTDEEIGSNSQVERYGKGNHEKRRNENFKAEDRV